MWWRPFYSLLTDKRLSLVLHEGLIALDNCARCGRKCRARGGLVVACESLARWFIPCDVVPDWGGVSLQAIETGGVL